MHLNMLNMFMINLLLFYQPEICFFFFFTGGQCTHSYFENSVTTYLSRVDDRLYETQS